MRVIGLTQNPTHYSCRSYLLLGEWNQVDAVNTLIDPGTDDYVIREIESLATGCGKVPVEQVLLTHNHFDHAASADLFRQRYGAKVYAWVDGPGVDVLLSDGQVLRAGDDYLEVLSMPGGHSSDSVAFYCQSQGLLFSGDIPLRILSHDGNYTHDYVDSVLKLTQRRIDMVYPGHGEPLTHDVHGMLLETLRSIRTGA